MQTVSCSVAALAIHRTINRTTTAYPRNSSLQERFEHWAARRPDAPAAVQGDREVSYRQLNRLANGLARVLRTEGVGPGASVGVCVPRSPDLLVALLGILKCGATFVPLDREWPIERFRHVVADAGCRWVISDQPDELAERFGGDAARLLAFDPQTLPVGDTDPPCASTADSVACVYYTSGSTGRPKGVPILHRGIVRTAFFTAFGPLDERSRILQLGSLTFDMATSEIWGALLSGGTSVLYPPEPVSLSRLGDVIWRGRVNLVVCSPTARSGCVSRGRPASCVWRGTVWRPATWAWPNSPGSTSSGVTSRAWWSGSTAPVTAATSCPTAT
jgi:non-ribosomal peptide synthetase component F